MALMQQLTDPSLTATLNPTKCLQHLYHRFSLRWGEQGDCLDAMVPLLDLLSPAASTFSVVGQTQGATSHSEELDDNNQLLVLPPPTVPTTLQHLLASYFSADKIPEQTFSTKSGDGVGLRRRGRTS